jgi:hypothetical protein
MSKTDKLIQRLDEARGEVIALLPRVELLHEKEIYPKWTIKEMLAHMTGWDDLVIEFVGAFSRGEQPYTPAYRMIVEYNDESVETREPLDYHQTHAEWQSTRERLRKSLRSFPDERFDQIFLLPWGDKGTVTDLVDVFIHHDSTHFKHINEWLQDPSKPLTGRH